MSQEPEQEDKMDMIMRLQRLMKSYQSAVLGEHWADANDCAHRVVATIEKVVKLAPRFADKIRTVKHEPGNVDETVHSEFIPDTGRFFHPQDGKMTELQVSSDAIYVLTAWSDDEASRQSQKIPGSRLLELLEESTFWSDHWRTTSAAASLGHRARAIYGFHADGPPEMARSDARMRSFW
ncbi:hypothetical protein JCM3766R1_002157 [Sporobolomyces carnicolor]